MNLPFFRSEAFFSYIRKSAVNYHGVEENAQKNNTIEMVSKRTTPIYVGMVAMPKSVGVPRFVVATFRKENRNRIYILIPATWNVKSLPKSTLLRASYARWN